MKKFNVWISKCYEINVDAENEEEAVAKAQEIPIEQWEDPYEIDIQAEADDH